MGLVSARKGPISRRAIYAAAALAVALQGCGAQRDGSTVSTGVGSSIAQTADSASPHGPIPRGWHTYRSTRLHFAIAYPSKWSVDESAVPVGQVSFSSADSTLAATISVRQIASPRPGLAVLRSRLAGYAIRSCEGRRTIGNPAHLQLRRMTFAVESAECRSGDEEGERHPTTVTYLVGVALAGTAEWTFVYQIRGSKATAIRKKPVVPMLKTLEIPEAGRNKH